MNIFGGEKPQPQTAEQARRFKEMEKARAEYSRPGGRVAKKSAETQFVKQGIQTQLDHQRRVISDLNRTRRELDGGEEAELRVALLAEDDLLGHLEELVGRPLSKRDTLASLTERGLAPRQSGRAREKRFEALQRAYTYGDENDPRTGRLADLMNRARNNLLASRARQDRD